MIICVLFISIFWSLYALRLASHFMWHHCRYMSSLGNKRVELFDMGAGGSEPIAEDNVQMASCEFDFLLFWTLNCATWLVF